MCLGTAIKDNVLFARLDFIFCRILSPPKSLREQLPGNARDRFVSFVHFFFYCLVGNKGPETEQEHSWGLLSPCGGRSPGQTSLYHCRCFFSGQRQCWDCCAVCQSVSCLVSVLSPSRTLIGGLSC